MKNVGKRSLTAIPDLEQEKFLRSLNINDYLMDENISVKFKDKFCKWIDGSTLNTIKNLNIFNMITLTNGSIQIFDHFYLRHYDKRIRFFKGEFMYHQAVLKNKLNYDFIEDDLLKKNDVFLVSVPFTRTGFIHDKFFDVMEECENKKIPVLLDFCHLPCSKNVYLDLKEYDCVETLSFSLSKFYHNAEFLRVGVRFQKEKDFIDDGIDVFNSDGIQMHNRLGIGIGKKIIENYPMDYLWKKYDKTYHYLCRKYDFKCTDNIIIAICNIDNLRVCVSDLIQMEYRNESSTV